MAELQKNCPEGRPETLAPDEDERADTVMKIGSCADP